MRDASGELGGKLNRLKRFWRERHCALRALATVPSVQTVQVMARSGPALTGIRAS